ncbi:MAG: GDSL-type esterase/lipase family protein [Lentimicrobiaceae bacterium]|nr:GDSL-type esterase/lipase family protein [Lentimicrobiaceae bacterium]
MKPYKILFFILLSFFLLGIAGAVFPKDGLKFRQWTLFFPSPDEVFKSEKAIEMDIDKNLEKLQQQAALDAKIKSLADSLLFYKNFVTQNAARLHFPANDYTFFDNFFAQLEQAYSQPQAIHVLHYGDSQIEMDRISKTFRQRLQEQFGGEGAGIVPAIQVISSVSVSQSYSGDLMRYIVYGDTSQKRAPHRRYGILASFSQLNGLATITLGARNDKRTHQGVRQFSRVTLIFGNNSANFSATCNKQTKTLKDSKLGVNVFTWDFAQPIARTTISLQGTAEIYGISMEGKSGVTVDNVPLRGCSGTIFTGIDAQNLTQCYNLANVKLIIMQFGGNFMPGVNSDNMVKYCAERIGKQIQYLQKLNPSAKILFIGPSDMSKTIKGKLQTYTYLPAMNEAFKQTVLENGAAYWDMFNVMGGENSMIAWVKHTPALAGGDYIHFTEAGAEKIATTLSDAFFVHYQFYTLRKTCNSEFVEKFMNQK